MKEQNTTVHVQVTWRCDCGQEMKTALTGGSAHWHIEEVFPLVNIWCKSCGRRNRIEGSTSTSAVITVERDPVPDNQLKLNFK